VAQYTLYYWPIPFRGAFVRAALAHAGASWDEAGFDATLDQRAADPAQQLVPHMGPPVLVEHATGLSLSQMPAILIYLGEAHGLLGQDRAQKALCLKLISDANDVLYEMTRYNGAQVWTSESWAAFQPRLARWMAIFEQLGLRHGLRREDGYMLGTEAPNMADLVVSTLWGTMTDRFPPLRTLLDTHAPAIAGLSDRIAALPAQAALIERSRATYGSAWCGGQIEASLRAVLAGDAGGTPG
tara:strand:+ start:110965 stop:111687 length:723 start_codon:yes stop_codon:yes gene_type:complete